MAKRQAKTPAAVRFLPAVMTALAALLGLKAVALAEGVADTTSAPAADTHAATTPPATAQAGQTTAPANACVAPSIGEMAGLSQAEVQVLQALGARRTALDQRATSLETQDALMGAAEQRLDQRLQELHRLEATVNTLLGQLDEAQETRIRGLVDVYQRMRAKDAAAVFDGLEDSVLVQVASRMRQANLAEVMGKMQPERARHLTQMLAELSRPPADAQALLNRGGAQTAPNAGH